MSEWQSIETAPKDGTEILGVSYHESGKYAPDYSIIVWQSGTWVGRCDGYNAIQSEGDTWTDYHTPFCNYWMPLPAPPAD